MSHNNGTVQRYSIIFPSCSLQGPAFYAYNDAQFQEKDWKGIRMLQESVKEKEPLQVGRFGLGFKSVLHMTGNKKFHCNTGLTGVTLVLYSKSNNCGTYSAANFTVFSLYFFQICLAY